MKPAISETDLKWIEALRTYYGRGTGQVPFYLLPDGTVDAEKTVERFVTALQERITTP